ncbi:MAG: hypothetical protein U5L07_15395 [Desulfobacterales bacterium]|nr:hypothetical protein [Desulfobacterales bacterium]
MAETPISFKSEELTIDGRLAMADANRGVVITHPHPLFGGDMNNPVVQSIKSVYQRKGYTWDKTKSAFRQNQLRQGGLPFIRFIRFIRFTSQGGGGYSPYTVTL